MSTSQVPINVLVNTKYYFTSPSTPLLPLYRPYNGFVTVPGGSMASPDVLEIVALTRNEGRQGLEQWFRNHLSIFSADPASAESFYWLVKNESPGAAYLLAFLFRANKLAIPKVDSDLELPPRHATEVLDSVGLNSAAAATPGGRPN